MTDLPSSQDNDNATENGNTLPPGYRLQEYVITRMLGAGGFGVTYLGLDAHLDKPVAIKEYFPFANAVRIEQRTVAPRTSLRADLDEYEWGMRGFIDEARALGRFEHRNIVRVLRYLEANGTAYIIMEFADGRPLSELIRATGTLDAVRVRGLLLPLLDGLELVHQSGMLHRDIKPGNIILRQDGSPVLIDFGAARQAIGARSASISTVLTPGYAPIEQYSSHGDQGPWTDLYALAAVAYVALVGQPPHEATLRVRHDDTEPALKAAKDRSDTALLTAIDWALSPEERDRPQCIAEWREALSAGVNRVPKAKKPPSAPGRKEQRGEDQDTNHGDQGINIQLIVGGLAAVLIVAVAIFFYNAFSTPDTPGASIVAPPPAKPVPTSVVEVASRPEPAPSTSPAATPTPQPNANTAALDEQHYRIAQQVGVAEAYVLYLRLHADGRFRDEAIRLSREP
ncbi:serine/threonine protein kinase [Pseudomonas sp. 10-1B]|uniref:serine/threonine protein kinase n=1 Tax=Pseudomonas sp. 10-1B TaxID=1546029 RepID=UPI0006A77358|nr:serine/threonine-protein kinase [Pseudomonas sp. 10-1B]